MKDHYKPWTLIDIAEAHIRVGDLEGARQTAATIQEDGFRWQALGAIAVAQARAGDVTGARQTVASIPDED